MKHVKLSLTLTYEDNHTPSEFEYDIAPSCCESFKASFSNGGIFLSDFASGGANICYVMLVTAEGEWLRPAGVPITFCPFCGSKINVRKKYRSLSSPT